MRICYYSKLVIGMAACVLSACSRTGSHGHVGQPTDSLYTERAALKIYGRDPQRALAIIDSAEIVGNVTSFKADFIRATILAQSIEDPQQQRALVLCDSLLTRPEASGETTQSANMRSNILRLLQGIYRVRVDNEKWLKCSIELAELNRKLGEDVEVLRIEADIALAYVLIGREEEGTAMLNRTISALAKGDPSVDRMDAWIVATKRKINLLFEKESYEEIVRLAQAIVSKLDHYEANASDYGEDSFRLHSNPEDRKRYCDFYRSQANGFLARAYAELGQFDEARTYLDVFEKSDYGQTYSGRVMASSTWALLGEWRKYLAIAAEAEEQMGADTLNQNYASFLRGRSKAAKAEGRYREAYGLLNRYANIQGALDREFRKGRAQEYAARYHEQERQLALDREQAERRHLRHLIFGLTGILLLTVVFVVILYHQMRTIRKKNAALSREITELIDVHENYLMSYGGDTSPSDKIQQQQARLSDMTNEELFEFLGMAIVSEHLFKDPLLDRQHLMERFHLSKDRIGAAFSQGSRYVSLKVFLNNTRLKYAAKMLITHPEMTIAEVASASGFSSGSIFARNFKQQFALTPTEFREQKGKNTTIQVINGENVT